MSTRLNFFFTEALRSLSTNLATSVAATLSMLTALLVVGLFMIIVSIVVGESNRLGNDAGVVKVFLQETASEQDVNALRTQLERMGEVEAVTYVSKADALVKAKKLFKDNPEVVKNLPGNPFPASLNADLKDPKKVEVVANRMKGGQGVDDVSFGGDLTKKVIRGASFVSGFMLLLGLGLVIAATLLVSNTIRLSIFARRRDIEVMKLVGASNMFVRLPFVIEGFLCGLAAAVGAVLVLFFTKKLLGSVVENLGFGTSVETPVALIFLGLIAMGVLLGGFGSGMTIRKYLRV